MTYAPPSPGIFGKGVARLVKLLLPSSGRTDARTGTRQDNSFPNGNGKPPRPAVALGDKDNADSEISPDDQANPPEYENPADEKALWELISSRYNVSSQARRPHEGRWVEALAFWGDRQWGQWNSTKAFYEDMRDTSDPGYPYRIYEGFNAIKPGGKKIITRALALKLTANVVPLTSLASDQKAAAEGRGVLSDCDHHNDWDAIRRRLLRGAVAVGTHFDKIAFDPSCYVPAPVLAQQPDGDVYIQSIVDKPLGRITETVVPCFEVYPDPKAETWDECRWLIHSKIVPLEVVAQMFGKDNGDKGKYVKADGSTTGPSGSISNLLDGVTGDYNKDADQNGKLVTLHEMWEKPSRTYPKGRTVWAANGVILWAGDWLYPKLKHFPFVPLEFAEGIETLWGENAVTTVINPQRTMNRVLSSLGERVKEGPKLLYPAGFEISPNSFSRGRPWEKIIWKPLPELAMAFQPQYLPPAPLDPISLQLVQISQSQIQDGLSVHEVSNGIVPPGVDAAAAIQSLQDADATDGALFASSFESFCKRRGEVQIAIAQQCYTQPRLLSVSDTAPTKDDLAFMPQGFDVSGLLAPPGTMPQFANQVPGMPGEPAPPNLDGDMQGPPPPMPPAAMGAGGMDDDEDSDGDTEPARSQAFTFQHLSAGRVLVEVASDTPQKPAARVQTILDLFKVGAFTPEQLPITIEMLEAMNVENPDKTRANLIAAGKRIQAQRDKQQADQAAQAQQLQQQQNDAAMQMQQAKAQSTPQPPDPQQEATIKAQLASLDAQNKAQEASARTQDQAALNEQTHNQKLELIDAQARTDIAKNHIDRVSGAVVAHALPPPAPQGQQGQNKGGNTRKEPKGKPSA